MTMRWMLVGVMLLSTCVLHAQTGCVNSPECPTGVLAMVGAAAVAVIKRRR